MAYKLSIRKEAEAYQYYESCRENLGTEFISCIDEAISRIQNNPKQFRTVLEKVRRALVKRFLYGVYYTIDKNKIIVLAVVHARRNPKHWQSRS